MFKVDYSHNQMTMPEAVLNVPGVNTPELKGTGVATALFVIPPCYSTVPHYHPGASEANALAQGKVDYSIVTANPDNTWNTTSGTLEKLQTVVYPKGDPHIISNPYSEVALVQVFFNSGNPGTFFLDFFGMFKDSDSIAGLGQTETAYLAFKQNINATAAAFISKAKGDAYTQCL